MFTGIVEEMGTVARLTRGSNPSLTVRARTVLEGARLGDSICVNGVCLTVTALSETGFTVGLMPETLRRSNIGALSVGEAVNLERALTPNSRIGGHFVQGHIDGTGKIASRRQDGPAIVVGIACDEAIMRYIVAKGFVAVDGISLTVVERTRSGFTVSLVQFTQSAVTLAQRPLAALVNIENDILGKYVEQFVTPPRGEGLSEGFLREHGFL